MGRQDSKRAPVEDTPEMTPLNSFVPPVIANDADEPHVDVNEENARLMAEAQAEYDRAAAVQAAASGAVASTPTGDPKFDQLMNALVAIAGQNATAMASIAARTEQGPTPQQPFGQAKFQTPWNPEGKKYTPLRRPTRFNGHRIREDTSTQEEIDLLNVLKPGKYHNGEWVVVEENGGTEGASINIWISNKTMQQRMATTVAAEGKGLAGILRKMVDEGQRITLA